MASLKQIKITLLGLSGVSLDVYERGEVGVYVNIIVVIYYG